MGKRLDIQGLRGWAVLAVLTFHFFPSILPWGYLGVDVFFVLSGFLISLVLEKKSCCPSTYLDFYFKRSKRILPLALLVTLISTIAISQSYEINLVKHGMRSALYALFFATNFNVRDDEQDYFEALEYASDYFTHFWSLSVEIQFYVLAPLLLHMLRPSLAHPGRALIYLCTVSLVSLTVSSILPPQDAFNSTLCRLWQFLTGSIAFALGKICKRTHDAENCCDSANYSSSWKMHSNKLLYVIPLSSLFIGSCIIQTLGDAGLLARLFVTIAAASLLTVQLETPLLCHPTIQLLGDASYALYLLHWPVVCALKELEMDEPTDQLVAMAASIGLSIAIHLTFEKWYLTLPECHTFALVGLLYMLCLSIILNASTRRPTAGDFDSAEALFRWQPRSQLSANFTQDQIRRMNKLMMGQLTESMTIPNCTPRSEYVKSKRFRFCDFPNGLGDYSFLIIGNSYALNPGKLVLSHFKSHYSRIAIHGFPHCEPLIETSGELCKNVQIAHKQFLEDVKREKPDVLFISSRYERPGAEIVGNITSDPLYIFMLHKLRSYEKLVQKKVLILNSFPQLFDPSEVEKRRRKMGLSTKGFMSDAIVEDDEPIRRRNEELAKNCDKCVFYDIRNMYLNDKGEFMTLDPATKLRYFENHIHYTSVGLKVIEPVFTEMSKEFNQLLGVKYPENIFALKQ